MPELDTIPATGPPRPARGRSRRSMSRRLRRQGQETERRLLAARMLVASLCDDGRVASEALRHHAVQLAQAVREPQLRGEHGGAQKRAERHAAWLAHRLEHDLRCAAARDQLPADEARYLRELLREFDDAH